MTPYTCYAGWRLRATKSAIMCAVADSTCADSAYAAASPGVGLCFPCATLFRRLRSSITAIKNSSLTSSDLRSSFRREVEKLREAVPPDIPAQARSFTAETTCSQERITTNDGLVSASRASGFGSILTMHPGAFSLACAFLAASSTESSASARRSPNVSSWPNPLYDLILPIRSARCLRKMMTRTSTTSGHAKVDISDEANCNPLMQSPHLLLEPCNSAGSSKSRNWKPVLLADELLPGHVRPRGRRDGRYRWDRRNRRDRLKRRDSWDRLDRAACCSLHPPNDRSSVVAYVPVLEPAEVAACAPDNLGSRDGRGYPTAKVADRGVV
jgi:hypothetical protein